MNMKKYRIFIIPAFLFLFAATCGNLNYDAIGEIDSRTRFAIQTKILANDAQLGDNFGYSVAISGDYAIVGTHLEDAGGAEAGAAYIFY
jgi:hypothetical protein